MGELTLDKILFHTCPKYERDNGNNVYFIDTCCVRFIIEAKPIGNRKYEICDWRIENN